MCKKPNNGSVIEKDHVKLNALIDKAPKIKELNNHKKEWSKVEAYQTKLDVPNILCKLLELKTDNKTSITNLDIRNSTLSLSLNLLSILKDISAKEWKIVELNILL